MKTKAVIVFFVIVTIFSCQENHNRIFPDTENDSFEDIQVPKDFDWSGGNWFDTKNYAGLQFKSSDDFCGCMKTQLEYLLQNCLFSLSSVVDSLDISTPYEDPNAIWDFSNPEKISVANISSNFLYEIFIVGSNTSSYLEIERDEMCIINFSLFFRGNEIQKNQHFHVRDVTHSGFTLIEQYVQNPTAPDNTIDGAIYYFTATSNSSISQMTFENICTETYKRMPRTGMYFQIWEDLWPSTGDYDFNDVVTASELCFNPNTGGTVKIAFVCNGGSNHLGLGMKFYSKDVSGFISDKQDGMVIPSSSNVQKDSSLRNAILITNDVKKYSHYYRTYSPSARYNTDTISFDFDWNYQIGGNDMWAQVYLFYTNDRGKEIHVFGQPPTSIANTAYFGEGNDSSDEIAPPGTFQIPTSYYLTENYLPWGIEFIATHFYPSREKVSILEAYPYLGMWVESGGTLYHNWHHYPDTSKVLYP